MITLTAIIPEEELQRFYDLTGEVLEPLINISYDNDITEQYSIYLVNGYRVILNKVVITDQGKVTPETIEKMYYKESDDG